MSDDDRPKKSWREIDQQRDGSVHRRGDPRPARPGGRRAEAESRRYKSELERVFAGGGLPAHLQQRLDEAPGGAQLKLRRDRVKAIRACEAPAELARLIGELFDDEGGLPDSEDVLVPAVDHPRAEIALAAIARLSALRELGPLKRAALLAGKLRGLAGVCDEPEVDAAARALLARLG